MTSDEITRLITVCMHTWPNHRVDQPEVLEVAWTMLLGEVPYHVANEALGRYMKDGNAFFPTPGQLYQIVLDLSGALPEAAEAWGMVQARVRSTYPGHEAAEWDAPYPVRQAARAMGGVYVLRMSEEPMADRAHFIKFYQQYRQRAAREVNIGWLLEYGQQALEPGFTPERQVDEPAPLRALGGGA